MHIVIDTNVLLDGLNIKDFEKVYIPSPILEELDNLKRSRDIDLAYKAKEAIKMLEGANNIEIRWNSSAVVPLEISNDNEIISYAKDCCQFDKECMFLSNDYNVRLKSKHLGIPCKEYYENKNDNYTGWKIIDMNEVELANWYECEVKANLWDLHINEYLLIRDKDQNKIVDSWVWTNKGFRHIATKRVNSNLMGKLSLKDEYQICLIDSMFNNQMTMVKGKPGSGKSLLSLSYAMSAIEKGTYDKLVVFVNNLPAKNAVKIGFLPGSKDEKLIDSQIGHMLGCKFGDKSIIEQMINQNKLLLLPFSDIRGFDTTNMKAIIYITEAQNLDISLVKLAIQRIGEDCQLIIDGDYNAQVDLQVFEGNNNGMRRVSEIFRNCDFYGEVELPIIYRSKMAQWADNL